MIIPSPKPVIVDETHPETEETSNLTSLVVSISDIAPLAECVQSAWPAERWRDCGVVVGCSGGADSVALAITLSALRNHPASQGAPLGFLKVVHVNHGLRGDASDGDEQFVSELAGRLGLEFHVVRLSEIADDEASLRSAREAVFSDYAHSIGARYVAVGHTADDNAETMLHHLFRGTGPAGLSGIAPFRPLGSDAVLVRPMLAARRVEIRSTLHRLGIAWREDASNTDTRYTRNWIRHELLPLVESRYPDAVPRVANAASLQREWRLMIEQQASQWLEKYQVPTSADEVHIRRGATAESTLIIEALQQVWRQANWPRIDMTSVHWKRIAQSIVSSEQERYTLPGSVDVVVYETLVRMRR